MNKKNVVNIQHVLRRAQCSEEGTQEEASSRHGCRDPGYKDVKFCFLQTGSPHPARTTPPAFFKFKLPLGFAEWIQKIIVCALSLGFPLLSWATSGIYISVDTGLAEQSGLPDAQQSQANTVETDLMPPAWRAVIGYNHDFNSHFGIGFEGGPGYYAKTTYQFPGYSNSVSEETLEFLSTATWHVNRRFDLIGKIGGLRITPEISGPNAPEQDTQIRFETAIGAAYNVTRHAAATLTYAHVAGTSITDFDEIGQKTPSLNEILLGIRYTFAFD
ncbi:MAG: outer membrane beta-barrel protein [Gammaproteobacteria bacterium]